MAFITEEELKKSNFQISLCCVVTNHNNHAPTTHCGIVLRDAINPESFIFSHHGWHTYLYWHNYLPEENKYFVGLNDYSELNDPNRYLTDPIIELLNTFYEKNKYRLGYGLFFDELIEANNDGELNELGKKLGLTCSTYVIVMFKSYLKPLLNPKAWKARPESDAEFKDFIINLMENDGVTQIDHIEEVKKQEVPFRFKPEEVVAAGINYPEIPTFEYCEKLGQELYQKLVA